MLRGVTAYLQTNLQAQQQGETHLQKALDKTPNKMQMERNIAVAFQNLAVYGYFTGGKALPSPDQANIFIESYDQGWLWNIPLHTGQTGVGAVVDSQGSKGQILYDHVLKLTA